MPNEIENGLLDGFKNNINYGFSTYRDLLFGIFIGLFIGWAYHRMIGSRSLRKSYERLLEAKEETIDGLKGIVGKELGQFTVQKKDQAFFNKLKKFFRTGK